MHKFVSNIESGWAVVVAQLVTRLLLPRGSNPVIGKIYIERLLSAVSKRRK